LLLIGSSPLVDGIPAFFAARRNHAALIPIRAPVFAASTVTTYLVLHIHSAAGSQSTKSRQPEGYRVRAAQWGNPTPVTRALFREFDAPCRGQIIPHGRTGGLLWLIFVG
jgi:hypothetical protein